jgi:predicted membrane chloride channel (bestrophin family)
VLPNAAKIALPCACIGGLIKLVEKNNIWGLKPRLNEWDIEPAGFTSFSALLGFLVIFRTSQAYSRYWSGCQLVQQVNGSFYDAVSSIIAFTKMSKASAEEIASFRRSIICSFSLLTALCYHDLLTTDTEPGSEESIEVMEKFDVIGIHAFSEAHYRALRNAPCRPSLVFHWIQSMIVEQIPGLLNVPPPILGRAFQELAEGLVKYEDCIKVAFVPFPFQYTQATTWLMFLHWFLAPLTVGTFTYRPSLAFVFTFVLVFTYWALFLIAEELENPFGEDDGDLDLWDMQRHLNSRFRMLLAPSTLQAGRLNLNASLATTNPVSPPMPVTSERAASQTWAAASTNVVTQAAPLATPGRTLANSSSAPRVVTTAQTPQPMAVTTNADLAKRLSGKLSMVYDAHTSNMAPSTDGQCKPLLTQNH